ncbi:MAG TPA: SDR family oxidoreductase [Acidimicrobiales bacterium]|nr:SDR family oxidoreductase [Acidimicrobiales bacterium]
MARAQELADRVAIVTGGASGIGRATVELFVEEGARVVIADTDAARGDELAAQLGDKTAFKRTDVTRVDEVEQVVDFAAAHFGGLHVMVNNAGVSGSRYGRFLDDPLDDFQRVMGVNLFGVMAGSQGAGRYMARNGGGSIVNIASIAGLSAGGGVMTYRAAKAAVVHFSRSIAIDLAEDGIRVNCVAPGHISTGMTSYDMAAVMRLTQPLQRQGLPRDVAEAVLYLASERSAQVTGIVLTLDGGTTAGPPLSHLRDIMAARAGGEPPGRREEDRGGV